MLTIIKLIIYYFIYQLGFGTAATFISKLAIPMDMATMISLAMGASTLAMTWHLLHFQYVSLKSDKYREMKFSSS